MRYTWAWVLWITAVSLGLWFVLALLAEWALP